MKPQLPGSNVSFNSSLWLQTAWSRVDLNWYWIIYILLPDSLWLKLQILFQEKKGAKLYTFLWDIPTWRTRPIELQLLLGKKCRAFSTCNSSSFSIWQCHPHASCRMFVHMSSASSYWSLPKGIHQHPPKPSWNQNPSAADGVMTGAWKPLSAFSLKDVDSACRIGKQIFH